MTAHSVDSSVGTTFEVQLDNERRIVDVVGDWPQDGEFELRGVPAHEPLSRAPEHLRAHGAKHGLGEVCFHSDHPCRTCWCTDGGRMVCKPQC